MATLFEAWTQFRNERAIALCPTSLEADYRQVGKWLARCPKPPSLKEQALDALELFIPFIESENKRAEAETIRRALEALPND
jgi:hypothetical protein